MSALASLSTQDRSRALGLALALALSGCAKPAWELPPPPANETAVVQPGALLRSTLDNGLTVMVLEDHSLPKVSIGIAARRGAGAVPRSRAGLASLTAEVMKRGAGKRDALALARAVDEVGGSLSVSAGWDSMSVALSGLTRDLDRFVDVLGDVTLRPRIEIGEVQKARAEQLASIAQAVDDPATLASWHTARALYPEHRYGLPIQGTPETVAQLDAVALRGLHDSYFVPENAILFASGDVDSEDILRRAREVFGATRWPRSGGVVESPAPPAKVPPARKVVIVDRPDLVQARIAVAHEGIQRSDDRRIAADLMNNVLGGSGFSSRLMKNLRSDAGLTYGVWSGFSMRRHPGPFRVSTFTRVPETRRAIDLVLQDLESMRGADPPSESELAKAASYNVGRFGLSLETSGAVLSSLVSLDVYGLPEDSLDTYRSRVRAVTVGEAALMARELLHPERAAIVVVGPAEVLRSQLEGLGPIEVVQP